MNFSGVDSALVMAIINASPESFALFEPSVAEQIDSASSAIALGAEIIDIGGCSTRPGSEPVSADEEWSRIEPFLQWCCGENRKALLSVDTFRPQIAKLALEGFGVDIINDVSGGSEEMYDWVAKYNASYVLTYSEKSGSEDIVQSALSWFENSLTLIGKAGIKNIILDPGFGFNKSFEQNWQLLNNLYELKKFGLPILVGLSRKSMIQQAVLSGAQDALTGTSAAHVIALQNGADILRVHDVKAAKDVLNIYKLTK